MGIDAVRAVRVMVLLTTWIVGQLGVQVTLEYGEAGQLGGRPQIARFGSQQQVLELALDGRVALHRRGEAGDLLAGGDDRDRLAGADLLAALMEER